jgi:hypothetical protein
MSQANTRLSDGCPEDLHWDLQQHHTGDQERLFGANSGNAVQMSMRTERLSYCFGLLQAKPGFDPVEAHHA